MPSRAFGQRPAARVASLFFFFDEIQIVPGWEAFVRRLLDSEKADIFVSGSSAQMLSREVASSLRGRAAEVAIFPYSFREYLRHHKIEIPTDTRFVAKAHRSKLERAFKDYLTAGGFPEAQGLAARDRLILLQSYVNTCLFGDDESRNLATKFSGSRVPPGNDVTHTSPQKQDLL